MRGKLNILVSGGTGTGKTTNLNVLSSFIPDGERIVTIEDSAELQLQQPHVISLEARPPNAEGAGEVRIRDLVRNSLRMRPDRIIVGEVRGAEALDMLQAMNTGHEGSMTTVHANSTRDALSRLETMVLMAGLRPADAGHPRADRRRARRDHAARPHARRPPRRHRHHRGPGHGGRHDPAAGRLPLPWRTPASTVEPAGELRRHRPAAALPRQARRARHRGARQGLPSARAASRPPRPASSARGSSVPKPDELPNREKCR